MADKQPEAKTKRRIVKSPETFRERAVKATEDSGKTSRRSKVARVPGKVLAPVARPVGKVGARVGRLKPFRILGLILLPRYVRNSWKELRMVTWPSRKQSRKLTFAVIVFAAIFGIIVAGVDFGLDKLFKQVLLK